MKKHLHYTVLINDKIAELFIDGSISLEELKDSDNATALVHAVSNMVPTNLFNKLFSPEEPLSMLAHNHMANQLVFQNSTLVKADAAE